MPDPQSTGAPRHLADDGDFVMVRLSVVDAVGFDAAVLFGWLRFRCELHTEGYEATYATLAAETRLSERKLKSAVKRLRDAGWIESCRKSSWDPTQVWTVTWERPAREGQNVPHETDGTHHHETDTASRTSTKKFEENKDSPAADAAECSPAIIDLDADEYDELEQIEAQDPHCFAVAFDLAAATFTDKEVDLICAENPGDQRHEQDQLHELLNARTIKAYDDAHALETAA